MFFTLFSYNIVIRLTAQQCLTTYHFADYVDYINNSRKYKFKNKFGNKFDKINLFSNLVTVFQQRHNTFLIPK